jgi:hypothetical protein
MQHVRAWSLRRWRHECRLCQVAWRGKFELCPGVTLAERYPLLSGLLREERQTELARFDWNAPTAYYGIFLTYGQRVGYNGGHFED